MNDLKFKLWIEIKKSDITNNWSVSYCIHSATIYNKEFFIEGYPINSYKEDGKTYSSQNFEFNSLLLKKIQKLLLPNSTKNYISVSQDVAWDYYHYCLYEGFMFNIHPISISNNFFRQEFVGSQAEIYQKCFDLNKKWISKNKKLI